MKKIRYTALVISATFLLLLSSNMSIVLGETYTYVVPNGTGETVNVKVGDLQTSGNTVRIDNPNYSSSQAQPSNTPVVVTVIVTATPNPTSIPTVKVYKLPTPTLTLTPTPTNTPVPTRVINKRVERQSKKQQSKFTNLFNSLLRFFSFGLYKAI